MNTELFDPETVAMDSPRLVALREHDVQTDHCASCDPPWLAIPMKAAREYLTRNCERAPERMADLPTITMHYSRSLDEADLTIFAATEREAQDLALERALAFERAKK